MIGCGFGTKVSHDKDFRIGRSYGFVANVGINGRFCFEDIAATGQFDNLVGKAGTKDLHRPLTGVIDHGCDWGLIGNKRVGRRNPLLLFSNQPLGRSFHP